VTGDELALLLADGEVQLLDVRAAAEYDGTGGYPCDPVQGHIPGAVNVDVEEIAQAGAGLYALLSERGIDVDNGARIVCYCHSGSRSAFATRLLASAGLPAENYEGSWHEWSRRGSS
jgi:thiosulfate/3-mercaptopyruvate sulfurtransferase